MKPGSIVKLKLDRMAEIHNKGYVKEGALAEVVDGPLEFPDLYKELVERIGPLLAEEFIWVRWVQSDPRWHGRIDGAYIKCRFNDLPDRVLN